MSNTALKELPEYEAELKTSSIISDNESIKYKPSTKHHLVSVEQLPVENETKIEIENENKKATSCLRQSSANSLGVSKIVEADFYCVISLVNKITEELEARVYELQSKDYVMDIEIPFSSFDEQDIPRIKTDSIFYWQIGTKTRYVKSKHSNNFSKISENFSEYRMRLTYVSKRAVKNRIKSRTEHFKKAFSI